MKGAARHFLVAVLVMAWMGAVLYPDPRPFVASMIRLVDLPVDGQAAAGIAAALPSDYMAIDDFVADYVAWQPAWTVYNLPWYFPTVAEVIADRAGDCQAWAVLAASIMQAKGMSYTIRYSFDHVWADYPGNEATALEDRTTSFVSDGGEGWAAALPTKIPIRTILRERIAYHWAPMPPFRKVLLLGGFVVIIAYGERRFFGRLKRLGARLVGRRAPAESAP